MLYPPELQIRLADYRNHADDADWVRTLERDCLAFYRNEMRVHGRLRPDAYPDVFALEAAKTSAPATSSPRNGLLRVMSSMGRRLFGALRYRGEREPL